MAAKVEFYDFVSEDFSAPDPPLAYSMPGIREEIEELLKGSRPDDEVKARLERADQTILDHIHNLPADYDADDPSQPPERWWWHLRAIKEGRLPMPSVGREATA